MTQSFGNIVLVGETGAGKSSIINMIAGADVAKTSSAAAGCTFKHHCYILPIRGRHFAIFDTMGLNEGERGTVKHSEAIPSLYKLITGLDGGINLLVFCMRGPRIKDATIQNWKLFHEVICKKEVPTLFVVTGLENEENMDEWWWNNKGTFENQGIYPDDTACITAIRGRRLRDGCYAFDDQYNDSKAKVMNLILNRALVRARHVNNVHWFFTLVQPVFFFFRWTKIQVIKVIQEIAALCGMSKEETNRLGGELGKC